MHQHMNLHTDPPEFLLFNTDHSLMASVTDTGVRLWDAKTWDFLGTITSPDVFIRRAAFTADPNLLVTADQQGGKVQVWDVRSLGVVHTLQTQTGFLKFFSSPSVWATAIVPVPHRKGFLVSDEGRTVRFYPNRDPRPAMTFKDVPHGILCMQVLERVDQVVVGGPGGCTLWDLSTGRFCGELEGNVDVHQLQLSHDGQHLYGLSYESQFGETFTHTTIHHWRTSDLSHQGSVTVDGFHKGFCSHPTRGEVWLVTSTLEVQVYGENLEEKPVLQVEPYHRPDAVFCLAVNGLSLEVLLGTMEGVTVLGETPEGAGPVAVRVSEGWVEHQSFPGAQGIFVPSPVEPVVFVSNDLGEVHRMGPFEEARAFVAPGHITGMALTADGESLLVCTAQNSPMEGTVYQLDARTLEVQDEPLSLEGGFAGITVSPEGRWMATLARQGEVLASRTAGASWQWVAELQDAAPMRHYLALNGQGQAAVITGELPTEVQLIDLASRRVLWRYHTSDHNGLFFKVQFSPDDALLAVGAYSGKVHVLDVRTGSRVQLLSEHSDTVSALAFTPDGHHLVSGGMDQRARVWDLDSGMCVREHGPFGEVVLDLQVLGNLEHLRVFTANNDLFTVEG